MSFSFLRLSFPTPDVKEGKRDGKTKKEKNTAKRTDKKEVHHKKANKERAGERERQFY